MPLHIIQELIEAVHSESDPDYNSDDEDAKASVGQVVMSVSQTPSTLVLTGEKKKNRTLKLQGYIGKQEILILVDSGSAGNFINQELANQLKQATHPCEPLHFTAADGTVMPSDTYIPQLQWHVQGHKFSHDTRVLPIKCYDMIIGADWLEDISPMWIHWRKKLLRFTHQKKRILLRGISDDHAKCSQIKSPKLRSLMKKGAITHMLQLNAICPQERTSMPQRFDSVPVMSMTASKHTAQRDIQEDFGLQKLMRQFITCFRNLLPYLHKGSLIIIYP